MRFSVGAISLLLVLSPLPAQAQGASPTLAYEAQSLVCASQFDTVSTPMKATLAADNQAGQLIEQGGKLALDGPPPGDAAAAKTESACQASVPPPTFNPQSVVAMSSRISRMPLIAARLTSGFGLRPHPLLGGIRMHSGVDLAAPMGSPIFATDSGKVQTAGWQGGYGLFVAIEHPNGLRTRYGHMSRIAVMAGQQVQRGQIIGFVGSTGRSTGAHLHYEVQYQGRAINPAALLAPRPRPAKVRR